MASVTANTVGVFFVPGEVWPCYTLSRRNYKVSANSYGQTQARRRGRTRQGRQSDHCHHCQAAMVAPRRFPPPWFTAQPRAVECCHIQASRTTRANELERRRIEHLANSARRLCISVFRPSQYPYTEFCGIGSRIFGEVELPEKTDY